MARSAAPEEHLFILRIWSEPCDSACRWRGEIVHAPTQLRRWFSDEKQLLEFIGRHSHARLLKQGD